MEYSCFPDVCMVYMVGRVSGLHCVKFIRPTWCEVHVWSPWCLVYGVKCIFGLHGVKCVHCTVECSDFYFFSHFEV